MEWGVAAAGPEPPRGPTTFTSAIPRRMSKGLVSGWAEFNVFVPIVTVGERCMANCKGNARQARRACEKMGTGSELLGKNHEKQ